MALSNIVTGKRNSIAASGESVQRAPEQRAIHAPMFARPGEAEPNAISGERLQDGKLRPAPVPTRSRIAARRRGLAVPEMLGITQAEIDAADAELLAAEAW
jgi:hypothetical protein